MPADTHDITQCRLESAAKWEKINLKIQHITDEMDVMKVRLDKQDTLVKDIQQLSTSVSILANNMKSMLDEQQKQNMRIQNLEMKPAKRWNGVVDKIISLVTAALVGALLIKLGLPM